MGGYITLAFAEKYPGSLAAFGLFHSSAYPDTEEKKEARLKSIEFIKNNGVNAFLKTTIPNLFTPGKHLKEIDKLIEEGKNFSPEALMQYYRAMISRPDKSEVLKKYNKPVLFLIGENDPVVPLDVSLKQCHLPRISHIHILKESARMGMVEQPGIAREKISAFLQNI